MPKCGTGKFCSVQSLQCAGTPRRPAASAGSSTCKNRHNFYHPCTLGCPRYFQALPVTFFVRKPGQPVTWTGGPRACHALTAHSVPASAQLAQLACDRTPPAQVLASGNFYLCYLQSTVKHALLFLSSSLAVCAHPSVTGQPSQLLAPCPLP